MASTATYWRVSWLIMKTAHAAIIALFREYRMWPYFIRTQLSNLLFLVIRKCCMIVFHVDTSNEVYLFLEVPLLEFIVVRELVSEFLFEKVCNLLFNWVINHFRGSSERTVWPWIRSPGQFNASAPTSILFLGRKFQVRVVLINFDSLFLLLIWFLKALIILCAVAVRGELAALIRRVLNWLSVRVLRGVFFISQWTLLTHFAALFLRLTPYSGLGLFFLFTWFLLVIWSSLRWPLLLLSDLSSPLIEYFGGLSYIKNAIYATIYAASLGWSLGVDHPITATVLCARIDIATFNQCNRWIWRHELLFRGRQ